MVTERTIDKLEFFNFCVITGEGAILGHAEENGTHHRFLIGTTEKWVKGFHQGQWLELDSDLAQQVRKRAESYYANSPVYRIKRLYL